MKHWVMLELHRLIADRSFIGVVFSKLAAIGAAIRVSSRRSDVGSDMKYRAAQSNRTPLETRRSYLCQNRADVQENISRNDERATDWTAGGDLPDLAAREADRRLDIDTWQSRASTGETSSPLSCNQQALYFLHRAFPTSAAYNLGLAVRLRSTVSLGALRRSVQALVDRRPILRTTYEDGPAEPIQIARGRYEVALDVIDSSGS